MITLLLVRNPHCIDILFLVRSSSYVAVACCAAAYGAALPSATSASSSEPANSALPENWLLLDSLDRLIQFDCQGTDLAVSIP